MSRSDRQERRQERRDERRERRDARTPEERDALAERRQGWVRTAVSAIGKLLSILVGRR